jgi:hypothetical protein
MLALLAENGSLVFVAVLPVQAVTASQRRPTANANRPDCRASNILPTAVIPS